MENLKKSLGIAGLAMSLVFVGSIWPKQAKAEDDNSIAENVNSMIEDINSIEKSLDSMEESLDSINEDLVSINENLVSTNEDLTENKKLAIQILVATIKRKYLLDEEERVALDRIADSVDQNALLELVKTLLPQSVYDSLTEDERAAFDMAKRSGDTDTVKQLVKEYKKYRQTYPRAP